MLPVVSSCGCGHTIQIVRAAREEGVAVNEIAPGQSPETVRKYQITVMPTVLFLDANGQVNARHEGEEESAIEAIRKSLGRLRKPPE